MTKNEVFERVKLEICDAIDVDPGKITLGTKLSDLVIRWNIDCLDILFRLEKAFGVKIATRGKVTPEFACVSAVQNITVQNIVDYLFARTEFLVNASTK